MTIKATHKTPARRKITAGTSITANARTKQGATRNAAMAKLDPQRRAFAQQIMANCNRMGKRTSIMGATNTSNIAARPDFMELLPMFVQQLLVLDVFGSVAMKSRQQLIPYFKFVAENTKGETQRCSILSTPFVNKQGFDPNFTGRVVKNEIVESATGSFTTGTLAYLPVLPNSVTISTNLVGVTTEYTDDGAGSILDSEGASKGSIDYSTGAIKFTTPITIAAGDTVKATYQYDNETVGPNAQDEYGAQMAKGYLDLDEINLVAEAHELACYWSIYSAFAAQQEYGANIGDMSKDAAFSELTAEINTAGFKKLKNAAAYNPAYNWDASPVMSGSVVPSDYINQFKLKLNQASNSIYQRTNLARPNRLIVGTNVESYLRMVNGFSSASIDDTVGPYKSGKLDQFEIYVDPTYDPNEWVMCCKSNDIRRNSALFGEYMPFTNTDAIGLANASVQQGYATMYAMEIVNPATIASGRIVGTY
jgi:hypothetical protein